MIRNSRVTHPEQGFTLLEVLIGLTLLSMTTVVVASGLRMAITSRRDFFAKQKEFLLHAAESQELILRLESLKPVWINRGGQSLLSLAGSATKLHYLAGAPFSTGNIRLARYDIAIERHPAGTVIDVIVHSGEEETPAIRFQQYAIPSGSHLQYFGHFANTNGSKWYDAWENQEAPPDIISLVMPGQITLDIRPQVDGDMICNSDRENSVCAMR